MKTSTRVGLALVVFFLTVGIGVIYSPSFSKCVGEYNKQHTDEASVGNQTPFLSCFWISVNAESGAVTALGTLIVALFTYTLWRSSEKDLEYRRTYIDRAYIDAGPGGGDGPDPRKSRLIENGKMKIRLQITNHGVTPAIVMRMCWHTALLRELPRSPQIPEYKDWLTGPIKVSTGTPFTTRYYRTYDMQWTDQHVAYGSVEYRDVFGKPHHHNFLLKIVKRGNDFSHPPFFEEGYEEYWKED
jgi:hypothetical protein